MLIKYKRTADNPAFKVSSAVKYLAAISGGSEFDIKGFKTKIEDGRLWVFEEGSEDLAFLKSTVNQLNSLPVLVQAQMA
ncbi:MAG: hypothetical protein ACTH58_17985 [Marinomonas foliarum]|uniref:hypothetical protein n=1 Tax=Marinomonas foliarum TaxID=491950 RepID=UPI003F9B40F3